MINILRCEKQVSRKFKFITEQGKKKERLFSGKEDQVHPEHINEPRIELFSNREINIDGCGAVKEYTDEMIRLKLQKGEFIICGKNFNIDFFNEKNIKIRGEISSLEFVV